MLSSAPDKRGLLKWKERTAERSNATASARRSRVGFMLVTMTVRRAVPLVRNTEELLGPVRQLNESDMAVEFITNGRPPVQSAADDPWHWGDVGPSWAQGAKPSRAYLEARCCAITFVFNAASAISRNRIHTHRLYAVHQDRDCTSVISGDLHAECGIE